jgi:hypothetical protein
VNIAHAAGKIGQVTVEIAPSGGGSKSAVQWAYNPHALARGAAAMILGALAVYCLHTGNRDRDVGRLSWAAILALGSLFFFI